METHKNIRYAMAIIFGIALLVKMSGGTLEDGVRIYMILINLICLGALVFLMYLKNFEHPDET